jgi:nucleotide-binding universal stress UspA family protein
MPRIRRILHPTDFSPASRPAFRQAVVLARRHGAQLLVAHVLQLLPVMPEAYMPPEVWDQIDRTQRAGAAPARPAGREGEGLRRTRARRLG